MTEIVLEGVAIPVLDDGERAMIVEISDRDGSNVFVRLQSWSDTKEHVRLSSLSGHKIKVTIEVMEDVASDLIKSRDEVRAKINSLIAMRHGIFELTEDERADYWARYRELTNEMMNIESLLAAYQ